MPSRPILANLMDLPNWDGSPKTEFILYDRVEFDLPNGETILGTIIRISRTSVRLSDCSDTLEHTVRKSQLRSGHSHKPLALA